MKYILPSRFKREIQVCYKFFKLSCKGIFVNLSKIYDRTPCKRSFSGKVPLQMFAGGFNFNM